MTLVVDGYNLLHASGILARGIGPGSLERSRLALLNFLAESLAESELPRTTVVFDAREAPPGLPRKSQHRGMTVLFAEPGGDADTVIEQLIRADSSPRRLTVVSSDHRLHRAARRRKAKAVDSDQWYADTLRNRLKQVRQRSPGLRRTEAATEDEVIFWLRQFGLGESTDVAGSPPTEAKDPSSPFPPGYGDDAHHEPH